MLKTVIGIVIASFIWGQPIVAQIPNPQNNIPKTELIKTVKPVHRLDVLDPTQILVPKNAKCGKWWELLSAAGWHQKDLPTADRIVFRESRCIPISHNPNDPTIINGVKGSLGLFQINLFWLSKTTSYPQGYLQTLKIAQNPEDLFVPLINARAALAIFKYSEDRNGCGWQPWATRCD